MIKKLRPAIAHLPATLVGEKKRTPITGFRYDTPPEEIPNWHHHSRGQLKWSPTGPDRVHTSEGVWITPPTGAVWIPPNVMHRSYTDREHSVFFDVDICAHLPRHCCIVVMTTELRETMLKALEAIGTKSCTESFVPTFIAALFDSGIQSIEDPFPQAAETMSRVQNAQKELEGERPPAQWAKLCGKSRQGLATTLKAETGMSIPHWQRQVRLVQGTLLLAAGHSVSDVARQVGYESASHWIATFKRSLGTTPRRYFDPLRSAPSHVAYRNSSPELSARTAKDSPQIGAKSLLSELVLANVIDYSMGQCIPVNVHATAKLHWPVGAQSFSTGAGTWVGHPQLAVWIPVGREHEVQVWGRGRFYRVHACPATQHLPTEPCAIRVTPRLRQAMLELFPTLQPSSREDAAAVFLNEVRDARVGPLPVPMLRPKRLEPLVRAMRLDPAINRTMAEWAAQLGMGRVSLARNFERELGMPFGHFQRLMRIRRAVELLALGESVSDAATQVGYANVGKFIAMFRKLVGATPMKYFQASAATEA